MTIEPRNERAEFYRQKAIEARAKAEAMRDIEARRTMLEVAAMWELMAKSAEGNRGPS